MAHISPQSPYLVTGTQRSGTTLLCQMLSSHPEVYCENELFHTRRTMQQAQGPTDFLEAVNDKVRTTGKGQDVEGLLASLGKSVWGLKDPLLTYDLIKFAEMYPGSKVVVIIRDGRAVASSHIASGWGIAANILSAARLWKLEVELQEAFLREYPEFGLMVRYESLVSEPEAVLGEICTFLGLKYSPAMLEFQGASTFIAKQDMNQNIFGELDSTNADRWRGALSARQVEIFESVAGPALERHDYPRASAQAKPASALASCYYGLHQRIMGEVMLQYRLRFGRRLPSLRLAGGKRS